MNNGPVATSESKTTGTPGDGGRNGAARTMTARALAPDWLVLAVACVGQFMVVLDVSIVNVALPSIRRDLGFSEAGLQWVVNAYTLTFAGFLLLGGRVADVFGSRRIFMGGLGLFTVASMVGGISQSQDMLVGARALQGLGAAVLAPATLTILTTTFAEGAPRAKAMGAWSAVSGAGGAVGALLGGLLTGSLSWRWILFINVPVGIVTMVAAGLYLAKGDRSGAQRRASLDLPGAVIVTAGLTTLVYGIVRSQSGGWLAAGTLGTLAAAVLLLTWFVVHEARVAAVPLMPLRIFRSQSLSAANLVMMGLGASLFGTWFFMSLYLQGVLHYSPLRTGFAFFPQTVAIIVGAQVSSRLVGRIGVRPFLIGGPLLSAAGLYWLSFAGVHGDYWSRLFVPSVLVTLGGGLAFAPVAIAATSGVARAEAGLASGLVTTARQVGGAVGLAALATVAAGRTHALVALGTASGGLPGPALMASALTRGYTEAFDWAAVISVGAAAAALAIPRRRQASVDGPVATH